MLRRDFTLRRRTWAQQTNNQRPADLERISPSDRDGGGDFGR